MQPELRLVLATAPLSRVCLFYFLSSFRILVAVAQSVETYNAAPFTSHCEGAGNRILFYCGAPSAVLVALLIVLFLTPEIPLEMYCQSFDML